ncbi:MAG: hypothetical protein ERJ67_11105 [Aphanocapsa feldmannii 277cV]|uniref:Lipoprotein n=1 Tax=Aphanocapsa feldmannii 277cV TaxID=2507553 RepID=A0A524RKN7_9CHRO|nr:MAG: hypothetical protein ERJ67_11105 [Aphanocapsa feldmannii 277cV]
MKLPIKLAAVLILLTSTAGPVLAACERSQRVRPENAPCMKGGYKNKGNRHWFPKHEAWATNLCSDKGKMVVKLDIKDRKDRTLHVSSSKKKKWKGKGHLRGIYYCKDLSHKGWTFNFDTPDWFPIGGG